MKIEKKPAITVRLTAKEKKKLIELQGKYLIKTGQRISQEQILIMALHQLFESQEK